MVSKRLRNITGALIQSPEVDQESRAAVGICDANFMRSALAAAAIAADQWEVPVGAVVVLNGMIVGTGYNRREQNRSPLAHAEMIAIDEASRRLGTWRLSQCEIYVTLEPCVMCTGAIIQARIRRLIFGCVDPKAGAVESLYRLCEDQRLNHQLPVVGGVLAEASSILLTNFFARLRQQKHENRKSGEVAELG
jgi:tRNA(adenine34) deaminase